MKLNDNGNNFTRVPNGTIDTIVKQISDLQVDTAQLDARIDSLGQSVSTVSVNATNVSTDELSANTADVTTQTVNTLTASTVNTADLSASTSELGEAHADSLTTPTANITNLTAPNAGIQQLESVNAQIVNLETSSVEANRVETVALEADSINNSGNYTGKDATVENVTASKTVSAKDLNVTGNAEVNNLNVNGNLTGVSDITANSIIIEETKSDSAEIDEIKNRIIYTDTLHPIAPTPALDNNDTYTIELPQFAGTFVLTWKNGNDVMWTATVIGNGVDYGITFGCTEDQIYINELFQWNKKLYIRHSANGQLLYSYNAEKELNPITIYYNMGAWTNPKSLEELTEEDYYYQVVRSSGTVWFGKTIIPRLDNGDENNGTFNFKGSRKLNELPTLSESDVGDVWNITEETYTDNRFVEGAGKPINAGDDVVTVEVETSDASEPEDFEPEFFGDKYIYDIGQTKTFDGDYLVVADETDYGGSNTNLYKGKNGNWTLLLEDCGASIVTHTGRIIVEKTYDNPSLAYSDDNGETWIDLPYEYRAEYGWGSFVEFGSRTWYFTAYGATYRSDDNGTTFTEESLPKKDVVQIRENVLITSYRDNPSRPVVQIKKSIDNGETWTTVSSMHGSFDGLAALNGYVFAAVTSGILRSSDEGATWDEVSALQGKLYAIDNKLFVLRDNDIYVTKDNGATFEKFIDIDSSEQIIKSSDEYIIRANVGWGPSNIYYCIYGTRKVLKWNKFAAGVNYENFVAENITATESLKSEGTLEVDGTSQFDDDVNVDADLTADKVITPDLEVTNTLTANSTGVDVTKNITHTGNYTATGNLNRTGNETITGVVVIGELD